MAYPPGWKRIHGDPGTATAALLEAGGRFRAYLNATPRQGAEALPTWARFRVAHNAEEGDRHIQTLAVGTGLRFLSGRGSCVRDAYATATGGHYVEVACLVAGRRATSVIVGAAPPDDWPAVAPEIERAIAGFRT